MNHHPQPSPSHIDIKNLFQAHITSLETRYNINVDHYSFITKQIISFRTILEETLSKIHSLPSSIPPALKNDHPLIKLYKDLFSSYTVGLTTFIQNLNLILEGLEYPYSTYQNTQTSIKELKDLQKDIITQHAKLIKSKTNYNLCMNTYKQQYHILLQTSTDDILNEATINSTHISKITEAEIEYKKDIANMNEKVVTYNNREVTLLNELETNDKILYSSLQIQTKAFLTYWLAKHDIDVQHGMKMKHKLDNYDYSFLYYHNSLFKPCHIPQYEFEPFIIDELIQSNQTNSKIRIIDNKLHEFICTCKKHFEHIADDYDVDIENRKQEIMSLCKAFLNESCVPLNGNNTDNASSNIISYLNSNNELRIFFLMYLNYLRVKGQFEVVNRKMFKCFTLIMRSIAIKLYDEMDFNSLRLMLTLSQTYYVLTQSKEKLYLIKMFGGHSLFKDLEFWKFYFRENVKVEVEKVKNGNDDDQRVKNNLVFSTIMGCCHNMMEFVKEKDTVKEMARDIAGMFELDKCNMEMIIMMVQEINIKEKKDDNIMDEEKDDED